jgi:hypothetical protein
MIRQWVRTKESPEFASGFVFFEEMPKTNQGVFHFPGKLLHLSLETAHEKRENVTVGDWF